MTDTGRYHRTGRTYVNIFRAFLIYTALVPGAHAPGSTSVAASRLAL
jgi:hypothetical protein